MPRCCCVSVCLVASVVSNSLLPYGPWLARLFCPWDSPGKNTGVDCLFLLPGIAILLQRSRCVSNEQFCLKTAGLYDDLLPSLFHFFLFHIQCSHLFYVFQFPHHLFFQLFFLKLLSSVVEKFFIHTHIHIEYV